MARIFLIPVLILSLLVQGGLCAVGGCHDRAPEVACECCCGPEVCDCCGTEDQTSEQQERAPAPPRPDWAPVPATLLGLTPLPRDAEPPALPRPALCSAGVSAQARLCIWVV